MLPCLYPYFDCRIVVETTLTSAAPEVLRRWPTWKAKAYLQVVTCPRWFEVCVHRGFIQIECWPSVSLLGLADSQSWPGAPLHEFSFGPQALAGRALDVVATLGGLEWEVPEVVAVQGIRMAVADVFPVMARHDAGCAVGAVTVQVVIWAPPASGTMLAFFALAPLAAVFSGVLAMMVITCSSSASNYVTFCAIHLRRALEGMWLCEELLDGMNKVSDAAWALAALLSCGGGALVL